jgi:NADH-quinone oxidoreductase subunit F
MENDPLLVLEGTIIASFALNVHLAFIYVRGEFTLSIERLKNAINEAYTKGFLGKNIMGSGFDLDVILHSGAGAYICGEETALIESIEGKRGQPRQKPPFPAVVGLFKGPTVVNNIETLAAVPFIMLNGAGAYRQHGTEKSPGTKLFSVSGAVRKPGVYEVDLGFPLKRFIDEIAGGTIDNKKIKAVIPGGSSTPVLTAGEVDKVELDYECLAKVGSMLGSGGIIVIAEGTCMVKCLQILSHFYADESCGKCTPCREGTGWMEKIIDRIEEGKGEAGDTDLLLSLSKNMMGRTICPLADAAAMPVMSFVNKFRGEFEEHIRNGTARKCLP